MSDRIKFPGRVKRRLKELPVLPTVFTSGNLGCGVAAILCASSGHLTAGCVLIFAAMICDMLDGKMARMTGTDGEFGAELDSLADVVSFGVAPALLVHSLVIGDSGNWLDHRGVLSITIFYPILAAIRLARYNVEHSEEATDYFKGLPSPGAASVLCAWILSYQLEGGAEWGPYFNYAILVMVLFVSLLMVSSIKFPHLGNTLLAGRMGFKKFIALFGGIYFLVYFTQYTTLAILTTGYVLYGFIPGAIKAVYAWKAGRSLLDDDDDETSMLKEEETSSSESA